MRLLRLASLLLCAAPLCTSAPKIAAQTYTPKHIRFDGGGEPADLLRLTGLQPGTPLTKEQIDAAMDKLAATGAFTDLSYTVNGDALIIKLAEADAGQALPVRYVNLVWWTPAELNNLVAQRVPLFHGELPLTGNLTDQVRAALVALLAEKGVPNATVEAAASTLGGGAGGKAGVETIALRITQPEIVLGHVELPGAAPATAHQLEVVTGKLTMQEFESDVSAGAIRNNVLDTERNAGFLDAGVDPPVFSPPRKDLNGYALDATAAVHSGELYRIGALNFAAADTPSQAPITQEDALKAAELPPGQPAGAMAIALAARRVQHVYGLEGYLGAKITTETRLDRTAHTAAITLAIEPGELYHLGSVDTNALPHYLQVAFSREFAGGPGMAAGRPLNAELRRTLLAIHAPASTTVELRGNPARHTVTLILTPEPTPSPPPGS